MGEKAGTEWSLIFLSCVQYIKVTEEHYFHDEQRISARDMERMWGILEKEKPTAFTGTYFYRAIFDFCSIFSRTTY
jgi:hypothetical protein